MVLQAIVWTVLAWVAGLLLDANLSLQPAGFLCLRAVTSENFLRRLTKR